MKHLQFVMTAILGIGLLSLSAHAQNTFPGSGSVGIGTAAPDALLHLRSGGPNSIIRLENTDYYAGHSSKPDEPLGVLEFASDFANMSYFSLNNPRAKVEGVNQNFSGGSSLIFYTANSTEVDPSQRLRIQADGNVTINSTGAYAAGGAKLDVDGQIRLGGGNPGAGKVLTSDANGVGSWTAFTGDGDWSVVGNDMFASVSGNVGIGSLNSDNPPERLLHLRSGGPNTTIRLENTSESAGGAFGGPIDEPLGTLEFASQIANQGYFSLNNPRVKITGVAQNASGGAALLFYTANSTEADPTSRMRIMADGSVAINSTGAYAQAKLDVDGQIRLAGGSPGAGKVLTSDANGVGSWETPSDGGGGTAGPAGPAGAAGAAGEAGAAGAAGAQGAQGKQGPSGQDASSDCVDCADVQTVVFDASCKIFAGDFSNTAQFSECIGVLASFKLLGTEVCDGTFGGEANCLDFIISNVQDLIDEKLNP